LSDNIERLLVSVIPPMTVPTKITRAQLVQVLGPDVSLDDEDLLKGLVSLAGEGVVRPVGRPLEALEVLDRRKFGPQRLIRGFCARHYGQVSPLIDRKFTQAILRRHGADHSLESESVQKELEQLVDEGLIKILGREDAYLKMLGAQ
jgi:hypothetical protein